ncbi:glycosyltransferase family 4 protein [Acidiphilium sp.]|uniref:glycosyltransferase family 4 protein n=1 Tax=Acidiphilium sp. TaxID=527 RepID=UPI003D0842FF
MRLILITTAPFESVSGASFYHRRLLAAWRDLGGTAEVVALTGTVTPEFADRFNDASSIIIEGAAFEAAAPAIAALQARGAVALIHHPTALEPGTPEPRRRALKTLETMVLPGFVRVIAASEPIAERLSAEFGVPRHRLNVLTPGTDHQPRLVIDPTAPCGGPCTILSLGTLTYRKGHDILIKALATLTDLDWHLILAGESRDPAYAATLDELIAQLGLQSHVERYEAVAGLALETLWARADMFALATRFEGFGMAIAEALARGLPVAITAGGAAGSLVPSGAGVVAPVDDVAQLGKAMRRLIFSPALRAEMGEIAWTHARILPQWPDQAAVLQTLLRHSDGPA